MTTTRETATADDSFRWDLQLIRVELVAARLDQRRKDTPAARARVRHQLERVDAVLDMWNDALRRRRDLRPGPAAPGQERQERSTATFSAPEATGSSKSA